MLTEICLIRHPSYDMTDRRRSPEGRMDPALSADGRQQAEALAARLAAYSWTQLYSSHLARSADAAAVIGSACGLTPEVRPEWAEFHKGELEGHIPLEVSREDHARHWLDGAWEAWPGGERRVDFRARVLKALHSCPEGSRTLVVTHGGVINEVLCGLFGSTTHSAFRIDYAGLTRIGIDRGQVAVASVNDTWHLEDSLGAQLTVFSSKVPVK
jgi:broad specificity phosphatase PhoE